MFELRSNALGQTWEFSMIAKQRKIPGKFQDFFLFIHSFTNSDRVRIVISARRPDFLHGEPISQLVNFSVAQHYIEKFYRLGFIWKWGPERTVKTHFY